MEKDLGMEGRDYNTALTVFFIAYAGAEPFTNREQRPPNLPGTDELIAMQCS